MRRNLDEPHGGWMVAPKKWRGRLVRDVELKENALPLTRDTQPQLPLGIASLTTVRGKGDLDVVRVSDDITRAENIHEFREKKFLGHPMMTRGGRRIERPAEQSESVASFTVNESPLLT
jgi:hypothetical protein